MVKRTSQTDDILAKLEKEGMKKEVNSKMFHDSMVELMQRLEAIRREYIIKNNNSEKDSSSSNFTA